MLKNPVPLLVLLAAVLGVWIWMVMFRDVDYGVQLPAPLPPAAVEGWTNTDAALKGSDLAGKWVVVDYWATWCGPCLMSLPDLARLHGEWKDRGVMVVGITNENSNKLADIEGVIKQIEGFTWPVAYGGEEAWSLAGVTGVPHIVLYNPEGKKVWHGHPVQLEDALLQHVAGGAPVANAF